MDDSERKKISSELFLKIWSSEDKKDKKYSHFYKKEFGVDFVVFSDIEVTGFIDIKNEEKKFPPLRLNNSIITEFYIENCKTNKIQFENKSKIGSFFITKNAKVDELIFKNSCEVTQITFEEAGNCTEFNFQDSKITSIHLKDKSTKIGSITIEDSVIEKFVVDGNSEADSLSFKKSKVHYLKIYNNSSLDSLDIKESMIINLELRNSFISDNIQITKSKIDEFYIKAKNLPEINVIDTFIEFFDNKNSISSTFNLENCKILNFNMSKMRTGKDGLMQLKNCEINNLKFDTILNLGGFNISNLKPLKIGERFNHTKDSRYNDVKEGNPKNEGRDFFKLEPFNFTDTTISILSSDMGKMMISSDLSTFTKFEFQDSKILDIFIAGPKLPEITILDGDDIDSQRRIAYNQIKKIYENRGDNVTALDYFSKEMEVYRSQVRNNKDGNIPGESSQLKFNQFTNQHGTHWRRPFWLVFGVSLSLFVIYYWLLFGFNVGGKFNINAVPYYLEFLNPTHKSNFIKEFDMDKNTPSETLALLIDYISRILVPLFLYQMIQAFRKYGKK